MKNVKECLDAVDELFYGYTNGGNPNEWNKMDEAREKLQKVLTKYDKLENLLGFSLDELREVSENAFSSTDDKNIYFESDVLYGSYSPEDFKKLLKDILGEALRVMRELGGKENGTSTI